MTIVNLKATSLDEGVKNMMNGAKADYVSWTTDKMVTFLTTQKKKSQIGIIKQQ